jgi:predicted alpha/beta-hydrolase family hydrolase
MQWYFYPALASDTTSNATLVNLVLLHGAGAPIQQPFLQALIAALNTMQINVWAGNFAYMELVRQGQRRPPPALDKLQFELAQGIDELVSTTIMPKDACATAPWFIAGKSMGSRVALRHLVTTDAERSLDSQILQVPSAQLLPAQGNSTSVNKASYITDFAYKSEADTVVKNADGCATVSRPHWQGFIALGFPFVPPAAVAKASHAKTSDTKTSDIRPNRAKASQVKASTYSASASQPLAQVKDTAPVHDITLASHASNAMTIWLEHAEKRIQDFAKLTVPGLILQGERDAFGGKTQLQSAEFNAKLAGWPNLRLQTVAGACHDFKLAKSLQKQGSSQMTDSMLVHALATQVRVFIDAVLLAT